MNFSALISLFSNRNYAIYTLGNTLSLIGSWNYRIAVAWLVWEMTKSPFWLGVVGSAGLIPVLIAAPLGGVLADRFKQVRVIAICQFLAFILMMLLYLAYAWDFLTLGVLIAFRVLLSTVLSISQPTRLALIPHLVGPDQLTAAISFGAVSFNVARFLGPALAGLILATGDYGLAFGVNGLSFLALVGAVLTLRIPSRSPKKPRESSTVMKEIQVAAAYIRKHPGISPVLVLFLIIVVAGRPIAELLPAFVELVYEMEVGGFALLTASMAIGSIVGGLWTTRLGLSGLTNTSIICAALYALTIAIFVLIPFFWLALPVLACASMFTVIFSVSAQILVQSSVEEAMRGRVMALWFVIHRTGPPAGALVMGGLANWFGLSAPFLAGAVLCLIGAGAVWYRRHEVAQALESPVRLQQGEEPA